MAGAAAALGAQAGGAAQAGVVADPRLDGVANGGVGDSLAQADVHRTSLPDRTPAGPTSQGCSAVGAFRQPAGGLDNAKLFQVRSIGDGACQCIRMALAGRCLEVAWLGRDR